MIKVKLSLLFAEGDESTCLDGGEGGGDDFSNHPNTMVTNSQKRSPNYSRIAIHKNLQIFRSRTLKNGEQPRRSRPYLIVVDLESRERRTIQLLIVLLRKVDFDLL